jgi:hypothetical protein
MDIDKLIESLSDESRKELLEKIKLIGTDEQEQKTSTNNEEKSFKRRRLSKKHSNQEKQNFAPPTKQKSSKSTGPVNNTEHKNLFDGSSLKNQERQDTQKFDKLVKRDITPRGERSTLIEIACRDCDRAFTVSNQLVKHDGEEYYYVCNKCLKKRGG